MKCICEFIGEYMNRRSIITITSFIFTILVVVIIAHHLNLTNSLLSMLKVAILSITCAIGVSWLIWSINNTSPTQSNFKDTNCTHQLKFASKIITSSIITGAIGFLGGIIIPNIAIGPQGVLAGIILGIFITGPIGLILGPMFVFAKSICYITKNNQWKINTWMVLHWLLLAIFYLFYANNLMLGSTIIVLLMLISIIIEIILLTKNTKEINTGKTSACGVISLFGSISVFLISAFPPVIHSSWVSTDKISNLPIPKFAFILNSGFDTDKHYPLFIIDIQLWKTIIFVTALLVLLLCLSIKTLQITSKN